MSSIFTTPPLPTRPTWLHFLGKWVPQFVQQGCDGEEFGWVPIVRRPLEKMQLVAATASVYHHAIVMLHCPRKTQIHKQNVSLLLHHWWLGNHIHTMRLLLVWPYFAHARRRVMRRTTKVHAIQVYCYCSTRKWAHWPLCRQRTKYFNCPEPIESYTSNYKWFSRPFTLENLSLFLEKWIHKYSYPLNQSLKGIESELLSYNRHLDPTNTFQAYMYTHTIGISFIALSTSPQAGLNSKPWPEDQHSNPSEQDKSQGQNDSRVEQHRSTKPQKVTLTTPTASSKPVRAVLLVNKP